MMFNDGTASFFFIQHQEQDRAGHWRTTALAHFLFEGLSYQDKRGEVGDRYRALITLQSANNDLWQRFGINGYVERIAAQAMLLALRERHPERAFRIAHRSITQITTVVHADDEAIGDTA